LPEKNKAYLNWIRSRPCCITHSDLDVVAHHITISANRGFGQKPSDFWTVPLRADLHSKLHHMGERSFWAEYDILRPHSLAVLNIAYYFTFEHKDDMSLELLRHLNAFCAEMFKK
jgi:hypothetical protein